ncbi:ABC transporter permease subunit [Clostridium gasigenes]|uniref:ABC transporter permease subunit n=1 Tax=Clostridium gasigenes TaxID=94869 RepID=UPI00143852CC|nr:ABC transporter permease subunit [Clostridium gasigenes]NKF08563.1 ABC transporter permease subunit [Clostridium gasigenes]
MSKTKLEIKIVYKALIVFFIIFLIIPLIVLLFKSFQVEDGIGIFNYIKVLKDVELIASIKNSIFISLCTAVITTLISFILAYVLNSTRVFKPLKKIINTGIAIPMLLPSIAYGFAIIYSFGKQGLLTKIFGRELFEIYGFNGLLIGYVIYTLPSAFLIINNSFKYVDKKFIVVSKLMGDNSIRRFINTILRPLIGSIAGAFVLAFILSFTDFGIPASVGGNYNVVATYLYQTMLGAIPNFNLGAVIAVLMLLPAVVGVLILQYVERFNFNYDKFTKVEVEINKLRDIILGTISMGIILGILSIFIVMFITPFMKNFPYDMSFTLKYFINTLHTNNILQVYKNSIIVATFSAIIGTIVAYALAMINSRTSISKRAKLNIDIISMVTNTVPGMVLGLAYLMLFNKSDLKGTFIIIIISNIVHFFTTPYLMGKNALSKMNPSWETTGELMGDSWIKTIFRVVIPNSITTIIDMVSYYFINSMVTISAIIFLVGSRTTVITTKIKEFQHYAKFNEIFVLSIIIFLTNIIVKLSCDYLKKRITTEKIIKNKFNRGKLT